MCSCLGSLQPHQLGPKPNLASPTRRKGLFKHSNLNNSQYGAVPHLIETHNGRAGRTLSTFHLRRVVATSRLASYLTQLPMERGRWPSSAIRGGHDRGYGGIESAKETGTPPFPSIAASLSLSVRRETFADSPFVFV